jgi:hypothetical protein
MFPRIIIWFLLLLIPFQSFAAVGLVQCTTARSATTHARHFPAYSGMSETKPVTRELHTHAVLYLPAHGRHDLAGQGKAPALPDLSHHHAHKLPCCSDAPIIFSPAVAPFLQSERFTMAVDRHSVGLTSVYLEGPKRPPRLTLS